MLSIMIFKGEVKMVQDTKSVIRHYFLILYYWCHEVHMSSKFLVYI